jgi:hypothetical protein
VNTNPNLPDLYAGIYRHYKGPLYLVLGYGHDANDSFRDVVVYVGLELDEAKRGARLAVRSVEDFFAEVHDNNETCYDRDRCKENHRLRFEYIGSSWEGRVPF